jgi:hypothetical protein
MVSNNVRQQPHLELVERGQYIGANGGTAWQCYWSPHEVRALSGWAKDEVARHAVGFTRVIRDKKTWSVNVAQPGGGFKLILGVSEDIPPRCRMVPSSAQGGCYLLRSEYRGELIPDTADLIPLKYRIKETIRNPRFVAGTAVAFVALLAATAVRVSGGPSGLWLAMLFAASLGLVAGVFAASWVSKPTPRTRTGNAAAVLCALSAVSLVLAAVLAFTTDGDRGLVESAKGIGFVFGVGGILVSIVASIVIRFLPRDDARVAL